MILSPTNPTRRCSAWALLIATFVALPAASAFDTERDRRSCVKGLAPQLMGECLRDRGLPLAQRLAVLAEAKSRLRTPNQRAEIIEDLEWGVLVEERNLRLAIGKVLVEAKVLSKESIPRLPGGKSLASVARRLVAKSHVCQRLTKEEVSSIDAAAFSVAGEKEPGTPMLTGRAHVGCKGACLAVYVNLTLLAAPTGIKLESCTVRSTDDGSCGCCMFH
jgi:hypothetical protein